MSETDIEPYSAFDRLTDVATQEQATGFVSTAELLAMEIEHRRLVEPFLMAAGVGAVVGAPDSGKSMFARQLAVCVGAGLSEFCGFRLNTNPERRRALYVATEDNKGTVQHAVKRLMSALTLADAPNLHFLFADDKDTAEILEAIESELQQNPADLVVVDTYGDVFSGRNSNDVTDTRHALRPFSALAERYQCFILFVHHLRKNSYKDIPDQAHVQGSGGFVQKVRVILDFRKDAADHNLKYLSITKANTLSAQLKTQAYILAFDEDTFLFSDTGERIPIDQIGAQHPGRQSAAASIDWKVIFYDRAENPAHTRQTLVERICTQYGVKARTADQTMRKAKDTGLLKVESHGCYSLIDNTGDKEDADRLPF